MYTKIANEASIAVLLLAAILWSTAANYQFALNAIVSMAALVALAQVLRISGLKPQPLLAMPSIMDRNSGSHSL